jgi:AraC-like DNA-binding protein
MPSRTDLVAVTVAGPSLTWADAYATATRELLRTRVQAATHGLQMGKPIKDIYREVGFGDYYYFLKAFKRVQGLSPGAYQTSYRASGAAAGTVSEPGPGPGVPG